MLSHSKIDSAAKSATAIPSHSLKALLCAVSIFASNILADDTPPDAILTADVLSSPKTITLQSGWNLISIPGFKEQNIASLFDNKKIENVWSYESGNWKIYEPNSIDEIGDIDPSIGYWVNIKEGESYTIGVNIADTNASESEDSINIGAMIWGDYTNEQIEFIANEPRIKLVSCLGNVDTNDALLLKQLNPDKKSLWFRTSINVGEHIEGQTFYGFWTKELKDMSQDWFFRYNPSTIDLVDTIADALSIDANSLLPYDNRVIDNLWSTYIVDPSQDSWKSFWRSEVDKQVIQDSNHDGVRMDVYYEKLEGWTKPAANLTKEQLEELEENSASSGTQGGFEEEIETIYSDRLPEGYESDKFSSDMLALMSGVKEELGDRPLATNPMWPSYDGTFEFYRKYAAVADILEIEMFVTKTGSNEESYQSSEVWSKQVSTMIWNELNEKSTLAFARGFSFDTKRRIYALASYLLGGGKNSLFYYEALDYELSGERIGYWAQFSYLPEWDISIGKALDLPLSHARQDEDPTPLLEQYFDDDLGIYIRKYENGMVLVNPSSTPQKSAYSFEKSVHLLRPVGGNVAQIHQMEDPSVLEEELVEGIISANPTLNDNFNRIGSLEYESLSTIQLASWDAAIILYEIEDD